MSGGVPDPLDDEPAANLARAEADLATALAADDRRRAAVLEALIDSGASLLLYDLERKHFGVLFGGLERARHVAVVVPGVGHEANLQDQWLPAAKNLFEAAPATAVILWKGYDNPSDVADAIVKSVECDRGLVAAGGQLTDFVHSLPIRPDQSLVIVAHSFGSVVTGAALVDCGLTCTDVVVAGSPGLTVDDLRQLHVEQSHFFSEQAPGDVVAGLGIFGSAPTSPVFGGTRMRTNAPEHVPVVAHSSYFVPGSEALENIVDVVTGRYEQIGRRPPSIAEIAGGSAAWMIRLPTTPLWILLRPYRGPGFRLLTSARRAISLSATEVGHLVEEAFVRAQDVIGWVDSSRRS